jgi:hypothetical protein
MMDDQQRIEALEKQVLVLKNVLAKSIAWNMTALGNHSVRVLVDELNEALKEPKT